MDINVEISVSSVFMGTESKNPAISAVIKPSEKQENGSKHHFYVAEDKKVVQ